MFSLLAVCLTLNRSAETKKAGRKTIGESEMLTKKQLAQKAIDAVPANPDLDYKDLAYERSLWMIKNHSCEYLFHNVPNGLCCPRAFGAFMKQSMLGGE